MKYVIVWRNRRGETATDNKDYTREGMVMFARWEPRSTLVIHEFVGCLHGRGGYAMFSTEDPTDILEVTSKLGSYFEFEVEPVIEVGTAALLAQEGVEFRDSKGRIPIVEVELEEDDER